MLLLCFCASLAGQNDSINSVSKSIVESRPVDIRIPDKDKIEEFKKDSRFDYAKNKQQGIQISWWDKLWYDISEFIGNVFSTVASSGALSFVVIMVCILLVCLLLMKLIGVDYRTVLGKTKIDTPAIDIYTENVHEMNFDVLISNALQNKNYRLAIRFLYLKNLKLLSDKEVITWNANKTNYSYQYEISNDNLRTKFLETTLIFDYVWYGEFPVEETRFSEISSRLNDFSNMIANER
ncbi:MAG: hypothetical protein LBR46_02265 [Prevotella sp.]|jgi:hypothetical protein|nr:hypothetical protein [Prevotella sp.]